MMKCKGDLMQQVEATKRRIVKILKERGKWSPVLMMQAKLTAQLIVKANQFYNIIMSNEYGPTICKRYMNNAGSVTISPAEDMYLEYMRMAVRGLLALGMYNERKSDGAADPDPFAGFFDGMKGVTWRMHDPGNTKDM